MPNESLYYFTPAAPSLSSTFITPETRVDSRKLSLIVREKSTAKSRQTSKKRKVSKTRSQDVGHIVTVSKQDENEKDRTQSEEDRRRKSVGERAFGR